MTNGRAIRQPPVGVVFISVRKPGGQRSSLHSLHKREICLSIVVSGIGLIDVQSAGPLLDDDVLDLWELLSLSHNLECLEVDGSTF